MRFQRHLLLLVGATSLVFFFQNCSDATMMSMQFVEAPSKYAPPPVCREVSSEEVKPVFMYQWDKTKSLRPEYNNVMSSAVVGDLDKDGIPEIIFTTFNESGAYTSAGIVRVISGKDGSEKFSVTADDLMAYGTTSPAIIDIDGDGFVEIFYIDVAGKNVIALNYDGTLRWKFAYSTVGARLDDSLSATDINGDGIADIIAPGMVISEGADRVPYQLISLDIVSAFSFAANVQSARYMNILTRLGVLDHTGKEVFKFETAGAPGVADLYADSPGSEVVVVGSGFLKIYSSKGEVLHAHDLREHTDSTCSGSVGGGQPTIGDFDGDPSTLEIAVATGKSLTIFDSKGYKIAGSLTTDCSSRKTGVASFDFNGDGKPEIVYADEQFLRIYEMDGSNNLKIIWEVPNPSGTLSEYPVVADVDNDGYANIVVVQNSYFISKPESSYYGMYGVRVFGPNKAGSWMPTRNLWNENSYMISNVTDTLRPRVNTLMNGKFMTSFKRNTFQDLEKEVRCTEESSSGTVTK